VSALEGNCSKQNVCFTIMLLVLVLFERAFRNMIYMTKLPSHFSLCNY